MWQFIVGVGAAFLATFAVRPKPQSQPPAALEDVTAPTAEEGRAVPVLFGCRDIRGSNVVWYGDLRTTRIKSKGGNKK